MHGQGAARGFQGNVVIVVCLWCRIAIQLTHLRFAADLAEMMAPVPRCAPQLPTNSASPRNPLPYPSAENPWAGASKRSKTVVSRCHGHHNSHRSRLGRRAREVRATSTNLLARLGFLGERVLLGGGRMV